MSNTINDSLYLTTYQEQQKTTGNSSLGKDEFLKILITQLQNQDPTSPMEDKDFIAQMAQFSSLEQMTNMNTMMQGFITLQSQSNLIAYSQFVGKEVNWSKVEGLETENPAVVSGVGKVVSVAFIGNDVEFTLEDGTVVTPANVSSMNTETQENKLVLASQLIGKKISYLNEEEEITSIVKAVSVKNGQILLTLDDEAQTKITTEQLIKIE